VARILHWLGDPGAATYFRRAAEDRTVRADDAGWYLGIGNYYRLAGDHEQAGEWLRRAHETFREESSHNSVPYVDCAYLLVEYEEAVALGERWNAEHLPAVILSRARLEGDESLARNLVGDLADHIRRHRISLKQTGSVLHSWDRYELALRAMEDLGNTVSDDEPPRMATVRRRLSTLVFEPDRDPVPRKQPQVLLEAVIQLTCPFALQKGDDLLPAFEELVAVAPPRVLSVGEGDFFGVAGVPGVLGRLHLLPRALLVKGGTGGLA
jgi:tetratricopeptide (TPR) repeat protein